MILVSCVQVDVSHCETLPPLPEKIARVLSVSALAAVSVHAQALAQGWNYYSGFNSLPNIAFTNGAMTPDRTASVFLNLNGAVKGLYR